MTTAETNRLAYKDMKTSLYLLGTFGFYAVVIVGAILIPSVSVVLDFAAAFAVSALAFGFPGYFYYKANLRFKKGTNQYIKTSYAYMGLAVFNCLLGLTSTITNIISGEGGGE